MGNNTEFLKRPSLQESLVSLEILVDMVALISIQTWSQFRIQSNSSYDWVIILVSLRSGILGEV